MYPASCVFQGLQPLQSFQQFPAGHLGLAHLITAGEAVSKLLKRANARVLFKVAKLLRMQVFQVGECGFCKSLSSLKKSFWEQMPKKTKIHIAKLRAFVTPAIQPN